MLSKRKASSLDILLYLWVPRGLLQGSDTVPTWMSRAGPKQGGEAQPAGGPQAMVSQSWVGTSNTFGFKEPGQRNINNNMVFKLVL